MEFRNVVLAGFLVPSVCFGGGDQAESSSSASAFPKPLNKGADNVVMTSLSQSLHCNKCSYCDSDLQFALCTATALNYKEGWEKFIITAGQIIERRGTKTIYRGPGAQTVVVSEKRQGNSIVRTTETSESQKPCTIWIKKEVIQPDGQIDPDEDCDETRIFPDCVCGNRYWNSHELYNIFFGSYLACSAGNAGAGITTLLLCSNPLPFVGGILGLEGLTFYASVKKEKTYGLLYKLCDGHCNCDQ